MTTEASRVHPRDPPRAGVSPFEGLVANETNQNYFSFEMTALTDPVADAPRVLSKAVLRAAEILGLTQKELARTLGTSPASLSRLAQGRRTLDMDSKQGELGLLLVRVFRSADALLGGNDADLRAWFHAPNLHLRGVPAERVQTVEGLVELAAYLDALRGKL